MDHTGRISEDELISLIDAVERQGGVHLPEACTPAPYKLKITDAEGKKRWTEFFTTGCGEESKLLIEYAWADEVEVPQAIFSGPPGDRVMTRLLPETREELPESEARRQRGRGAGFVVACAHDDAVHLWPRFTEEAVA